MTAMAQPPGYKNSPCYFLGDRLELISRGRVATWIAPFDPRAPGARGWRAGWIAANERGSARR